MELQVGQSRVGITFESLAWFTVLTALGTILGGIGYSWLEFYLPGLLPKNAITKASGNPATP